MMDGRAGFDASALERALPEGFEFYHLGPVTLLAADRAEAEAELPGDPVAIAYSLRGDAAGLLVLLFDSGLDASTYAEMGNVIGSRMATALSAGRPGVGALLSPPRFLKAHQLAALLREERPAARRVYAHAHEGRPVLVHAWILPVPSEGIGYA